MRRRENMYMRRRENKIDWESLRKQVDTLTPSERSIRDEIIRCMKNGPSPTVDWAVPICWSEYWVQLLGYDQESDSIIYWEYFNERGDCDLGCLTKTYEIEVGEETKGFLGPWSPELMSEAKRWLSKAKEYHQEWKKKRLAN